MNLKMRPGFELAQGPVVVLKCLFLGGDLPPPAGIAENPAIAQFGWIGRGKAARKAGRAVFYTLRTVVVPSDTVTVVNGAATDFAAGPG